MRKNIWSKKNIISLLFVGILFLAIPIGVQLVERQQRFSARAASEAVTFSGDVKCSGNECTTKSPTVNFNLKSPIGPPIQ